MSNEKVIPQKTIIIAEPDITQEYKNNLIKNLEEIEKLINYYFVIISSVNSQMMNELGNKLYECERKYNYLDIELKPFSKFVKNKFNYPFLKSKMNVIKNNYQQLENAINNKILNNIVNEEKEKLLPKNEKEKSK